MTKPNCYACKYRQDVPGDAHIACLHPDAQQYKAILPIAFFNSSGFRISERLSISAEHYGIAMGWFLYPINFDPTWLVSCTGFEAKTN